MSLTALTLQVSFTPLPSSADAPFLPGFSSSSYGWEKQTPMEVDFFPPFLHPSEGFHQVGIIMMWAWRTLHCQQKSCKQTRPRSSKLLKYTITDDKHVSEMQQSHGKVYHISIMTTSLPPCTIQWVAHYPPSMSAVYDRRRPLSNNLEKSSASIKVSRIWANSDSSKMQINRSLS